MMECTISKTEKIDTNTSCTYAGNKTYLVSKKIPSTFVDISAVHAHFRMKFYTTVKEETHVCSLT